MRYIEEKCAGSQVSEIVIGTTKPERIHESARACDITLTRKEWYEIYLAAGNKLP